MKTVIFLLGMVYAVAGWAESTITCGGIARQCVVETEPNKPIETLNGWRTAYDLGQMASFYKDIGGRVFLNGNIYKWGPQFEEIQGEDLVFVLPPGYRPADTEYFYSYEDRITITADGNVYVRYEFQYFGWDFLSGINFRAAPEVKTK